MCHKIEFFCKVCNCKKTEIFGPQLHGTLLFSLSGTSNTKIKRGLNINMSDECFECSIYEYTIFIVLINCILHRVKG